MDGPAHCGRAARAQSAALAALPEVDAGLLAAVEDEPADEELSDEEELEEALSEAVEVLRLSVR